MLCIILLLIIIGLAACIYKKRRKNKQAKTEVLPIPTENTAINPLWMAVHTGIYWDNSNGTLIKGEQKIVLNGESLKFFRLLIKNKQFLLRYEAMVKTYGINDDTTRLKDRTYHAMKNLRKELIPIGIHIRTIRGIGYQLTFSFTLMFIPI